MWNKKKMVSSFILEVLCGIFVLITITDGATSTETPAKSLSFMEKVKEFYSDKNNMAMYLVLPIIILVYGGCSLVYCCAKLRRYIKAKRQKKNKAKRNFEQADEPLNNNNDEEAGEGKGGTPEDEDDMKKSLINGNRDTPEKFGRENTAASLPNQIDDDTGHNDVNQPNKRYDDPPGIRDKHYNNLSGNPAIVAAAAMAYEDKQRNISPQNYDKNHPPKNTEKDLSRKDIALEQYPKSHENSFERNDSYSDNSSHETRPNSANSVRPGTSSQEHAQGKPHPWDAPEKVNNDTIRHPSPNRLGALPVATVGQFDKDGRDPPYGSRGPEQPNNDGRDPRDNNRDPPMHGDGYRSSDPHRSDRGEYQPQNNYRDNHSQNRGRNDEDYRYNDRDGRHSANRDGYPPPNTDRSESRRSRNDDNRKYNEPMRQPNEYRGSPIDAFRSQTPRDGHSSRYNDAPRNPSRYTESIAPYPNQDNRDPDNQWATKQYPPRLPPPPRERKKYDWSFDGRRSQMDGSKPNGPERGDGSVSVISYKDELMDKYEALSTYVMAQRAAKILRGNENEPPPQSRNSGQRRPRRKKLIFVAE